MELRCTSVICLRLIAFRRKNTAETVVEPFDDVLCALRHIEVQYHFFWHTCSFYKIFFKIIQRCSTDGTLDKTDISNFLYNFAK